MNIKAGHTIQKGLVTEYLATQGPLLYGKMLTPEHAWAVTASSVQLFSVLLSQVAPLHVVILYSGLDDILHARGTV